MKTHYASAYQIMMYTSYSLTHELILGSLWFLVNSNAKENFLRLTRKNFTNQLSLEDCLSKRFTSKENNTKINKTFSYGPNIVHQTQVYDIYLKQLKETPFLIYDSYIHSGDNDIRNIYLHYKFWYNEETLPINLKSPGK